MLLIIKLMRVLRELLDLELRVTFLDFNLMFTLIALIDVFVVLSLNLFPVSQKRKENTFQVIIS